MKIKCAILFLLLTQLLMVGCKQEDNNQFLCNHDIEPAPQEMPPKLREMMGGMLNYQYWLLSNPQGDTVIITAEPDYKIIREDHPECKCEDCPQEVTVEKSRVLLDFRKIDYSSSSKMIGPFSLTIAMREGDKPAEIVLLNSDDMIWDLENDTITDSPELTEQWKVLANKQISGIEYEMVFFRQSITKTNFDLGYEWILSPEVGYLALYDKAGIFYPRSHDTLTLKEYH